MSMRAAGMRRAELEFQTLRPSCQEFHLKTLRCFDLDSILLLIYSAA